MSERVQAFVLIFRVTMVGMLALLLCLQTGSGSPVDEEPRMINPQSLAVAALHAAGIAVAVGRGIVDRDKRGRG